jgi:DNA-binding protein HU-beta
MNKAQLQEALANANDGELTKAAAGRVIDSFVGAISASLAKGDEVTIPGFGVFKVTSRSARTGRNPQTGETLQIAASKGVNFKPYTALKDKIK